MGMEEQIFDELKGMLNGIITDTESVQQLALEDSLNSTGLDSIAFIKLIVKIEAAFDFEFDDNMLNHEFSNFRELVAYIERKQAGAA